MCIWKHSYTYDIKVYIVDMCKGKCLQLSELNWILTKFKI